MRKFNDDIALKDARIPLNQNTLEFVEKRTGDLSGEISSEINKAKESITSFIAVTSIGTIAVVGYIFYFLFS